MTGMRVQADTFRGGPILFREDSMPILLADVVLLSKYFPFKQDSGEMYLHKEIRVLSKRASRVVVVATEVEENCVEVNYGQYPENVSFIKLQDRPYAFTRLFLYLQALFNLMAPPQCPDVAEEARGLSIPKRLFLYYFHAKAAQKLAKLRSKLQDRGIAVSGGSVLYSYRLFDNAYLAVKLREFLGKDSVCVSRAHRYDLYEHTNRLGYLPMRRFLLKALDAVYPCSQDGLAYMTESYPDVDARIRLSYLGTDDAGLNAQENAAPPIQLLSCSNVVPVKRVDRIVNVVKRVLDNGTSIRWVHIGSGKQFRRIEKLCKMQLPEGSYVLMGQKANRDVIEYYKNNCADIFINLSASEGLPQSLMEACSFGVPILATDVGGTREILEDGENGWLVPEGWRDEDISARIVEYSKMSEREREGFRRAARRQWEANFSAVRNAEVFMADLPMSGPRSSAGGTLPEKRVFRRARTMPRKQTVHPLKRSRYLMDYILTEFMDPALFNARNKAREDTLEICLRGGMTHIPFFRSKSGRLAILGQMTGSMLSLISRVRKGDRVLIQYLYYPTIVNRALMNALQALRLLKSVRVVCLVHDSDALRNEALDTPAGAAYLRKEAALLNKADYLIVHNDVMRDALRAAGLSKPAFSLGPFDYLYDGPVPERLYASGAWRVVIAGALAREKSAYVYQLPTMGSVRFNLYGIHYDGPEQTEAADYLGQYPPNKLIEHLEGNFGLVWDGSSCADCLGAHGKYLRFNNPHKFSLYIAAELPVIIWSGSPLAQYVEENGIGFCIERIDQIGERLSKLTEDEYVAMLTNTRRVRQEITEGRHLQRSLDLCRDA